MPGYILPVFFSFLVLLVEEHVNVLRSTINDIINIAMLVDTIAWNSRVTKVVFESLPVTLFLGCFGGTSKGYVDYLSCG